MYVPYENISELLVIQTNCLQVDAMKSFVVIKCNLLIFVRGDPNMASVNTAYHIVEFSKIK